MVVRDGFLVLVGVGVAVLHKQLFGHLRLHTDLRKALREHAPEHIGAAARRRRDHQPNGALRIDLRIRERMSGEQSKKDGEAHLNQCARDGLDSSRWNSKQAPSVVRSMNGST